MAHPKSKVSRSRRNKRRTHYKASVAPMGTCRATGMPHRLHHAHWHEGKLYYKGKVVIEADQT